MLDPSKYPDERFELWSIPSHENLTPEMPLGKEIGSAKKCVRPGDVLLSRIVPHIRRSWVVSDSVRGNRQIASGEWIIFRTREADPHYLARMVVSDRFHAQFMQTTTGVGGSLTRANPSAVGEIEIPLPPLEVQREIVAEIEGYQKVIDGARIVLENYRPHITIDPSWVTVALEQVADINPDTITPSKAFPNSTFWYFDISAVENHTGRVLDPGELRVDEAPSRARRGVLVNDLLISTVRPNLRAFAIIDQLPERPVASTGFAVVRAKPDRAIPRYLFEQIRSPLCVNQLVARMERGAYPSVNQGDMAALRLPLPPLETQQSIVAEIRAEQALIEANRELIARFEKKIEAAIARVWGGAEGEAAT